MNSKEKVLEFDEIATNVFGSVYPVIAEQIIRKTGKNRGICLDIGSGGGHLGIEIAKKTKMQVCLFDLAPYALKLADERVNNNGLNRRVKTMLGDVHKLPMKDGEIDLVISRGSLWFWEDQVKAFKEIYRVLSYAGCAYIGSGYGNEVLRRSVYEKMEERESNWADRRKSFVKDNSPEKLERIMKEINIASYEIIDDASGMWVFFNK